MALAAVAMAVGWGRTAVKTVLVLMWIFVTRRAAAHAMARAADEEGVEPWTQGEERR